MLAKEKWGHMTGTKASFRREHLKSFGRRLRQLREARSWSLKRLAAESGVSVAAIQKIEAGEASPSLLTILTVVDVLGEPLDRLIADSRQAEKAVKVVRGSLPKGGAAVQALSDGLAEGVMAASLVTLPARGAVKADALPTGAPLMAYVLDGALDVGLDGGGRQKLTVGDALHASDPAPSDLANPLARKSVILCLGDRRPAVQDPVQESA